MARILVTGASGLLGRSIVGHMRSLHSMIPTHCQHKAFQDSVFMDVRDRKKVLETLKTIRPDIVIHTAAETGVDKCETNRDHAWSVNVDGTRNVAEAAEIVESKLICVSTDYVFPGEKGKYVETDPPRPINHYGQTKLKAEESASACKNLTIIRAGVLFGWHPTKFNFVTWVINSLKSDKQIQVVNDHYNSPTFVDSLSLALVRLIEADARGLYHTSGSERIDRYTFALKIAETFNLNKDSIQPVSMKDFKGWIAKRPRDSSLCNDKARNELGILLPGIEASLVAMKESSAAPDRIKIS